MFNTFGKPKTLTNIRITCSNRIGLNIFRCFFTIYTIYKNTRISVKYIQGLLRQTPINVLFPINLKIVFPTFELLHYIRTMREQRCADSTRLSVDEWCFKTVLSLMHTPHKLFTSKNKLWSYYLHYVRCLQSKIIWMYNSYVRYSVKFE